MATNVHLREMLHKSITAENHEQVPISDIYSENSALRSQSELLREELRKIKEYLDCKKPTKPGYRSNTVALSLSNSSGGNNTKKLMALKLIEFEMKSLRSRLEKTMSTNEFLNNEVRGVSTFSITA